MYSMFMQTHYVLLWGYSVTTESCTHSVTLHFLEARDSFYAVNRPESMVLSIQQASVWCTHSVYHCCNMWAESQWRRDKAIPASPLWLCTDSYGPKRYFSGEHLFMCVCIYVYMLQPDTFGICSTEPSINTLDSHLQTSTFLCCMGRKC